LKFEEKFFWLISIGHNLFKIADFSYGGHENLTDFRKTLYSGVFVVADYKFNNGFPKFKTADPI